jgi:hypothetical protein
MAYAGNPSDVAKQTAPSSSNEHAGSWQLVLAAIVIIAIIVVVAVAPVFNRAQVLPVDDERGVTSLSIAPKSVVPADRSVEQRGALQAGVSRMVYQTPLLLAPKSFAPADNSLAKAESLRYDVSRMVFRAVAPVDHRFDNIENLRGNMR